MRLQSVCFCIGLMLAAVCWAQADVPSDTVSSVLARHRAFIGWSATDTPPFSFRATGKRGSLKMTVLRLGTASRTDLFRSGIRIDSIGFTGTIGWVSNINGFTEPTVGRSAREIFATEALFGESFDRLTGRVVRTTVIDGTPTTQLRFEAPDTATIDAYFADSGALVKAVMNPDGDRMTYRFLKYEDLAGKRVLSAWTTDGYPRAYESVEAAPVTVSELHPPAPSAHWTFGDSAATPITVEQREVVVDAKVNGVQGRFLLDTGAENIVLTGDFARRAHLASVMSAASEGAGEVTVRGEFAKADTINVGTHVLHDVIVYVGGKVPGSGKPLDGLLGYDLLAAAIVDVDFKNKQIAFYDPQTKTVSGTPTTYTLVPDLTSGSPIVPVSFNHRGGGVEILLDSGDEGGVLLGERYNSPRYAPVLTTSIARFSGVGGDTAATAQCGTLSSLEIGPIEYRQADVCFDTFWNSRTTAGIVGFDLLRHFDWTFDYPESEGSC